MMPTEKKHTIILTGLLLSLFYAATIYRVMNLIAINIFLGIGTILVLCFIVAAILSAGKKVQYYALALLLLLLVISFITPVPLIPYFN